jgi:DNA-binding transcriptional LysR family regulator
MRFAWADLQIFLHVCEAGSMTAAAERCHLTLAAVSARVRSLEEANGVVLLQRHARGVTPTAAGEVLARHARLVFGQIQELERDLLHARPGTRRPTVLLANSSALARPLAEALMEPCGSDPQPEMVVRESPSEATVIAIRSGAADVGIVSDAVDTRGLVNEALGPDPLVLVVPRAHALAGRQSVLFQEVLEQPWVSWGEQSALTTHLLMRALALGARLPARITYPRLAGVLQLVGRGAGLTVLPQAVVGQDPATGIACVRLEDPWARRRLLACHLDDGNAMRARLAKSLQRHWVA